MSSVVKFGRQTVKSIGDTLHLLSASKVFLVTGNKSFSKSSKKIKFETFLSDFQYVRYHNFQINPQLDDVLKGIKLFKDFAPDVVVCVGGGSVLDMGKLVNILGSQENENYEAIISNNLISSKGLPLIAVPTTSGSGSESTHFAVVYVNGKKFSLAHPYILPSHSIIDPELCFDMPKYLAACSGMDALCQAIESFWSVGGTIESRGYALKAIHIIRNSIIPAVSKKDKLAMVEMSKAANLAGKAINISKTTAPHAISYAITKRFGIPHGHAVALTLGKFFVINTKNDNIAVQKEDNSIGLHRRMQILFDCFDTSSAVECSRKWIMLMKSIGLETNFKKLGIVDEVDIKNVIENVNLERLSNHPIQISNTILREIFPKI